MLPHVRMMKWLIYFFVKPILWNYDGCYETWPAFRRRWVNLVLPSPTDRYVAWLAPSTPTVLAHFPPTHYYLGKMGGMNMGKEMYIYIYVSILRNVDISIHASWLISLRLIHVINKCNAQEVTHRVMGVAPCHPVGNKRVMIYVCFNFSRIRKNLSL